MNRFEYTISKLYGQEGRIWLSQLENLIKTLQKLWGLRDLRPLENLSYNYLLSGFQEKSPIILKIGFDQREINKEARTLEAFQNFGAVKLLGETNQALLLEYILPGTTLKESSFSSKSKIAIACQIGTHLHKVPIKDPLIYPSIEKWLSPLNKDWELPQKNLKRARDFKKQLLNKDWGPLVLLHGDLHQKNILSKNSEKGLEWIVIDPKGIVGFSINEYWACIESPDDLLSIAQIFNYNFQDLVRWYYVHLMTAACLQEEDGLDSSFFLNLSDNVSNKLI